MSARTGRTTTHPKVEPQWPDIDFAQNPRLLVGWRRSNKRLDALRVRLDQAVFAELRALSEPTMELLRTATERRYEQFAALEPGEQYFTYDISDLPQHPRVRRGSEPEPDVADGDTADLVRLVRTVDALDEITKDGMTERRYSFYGICWPHSQGMVGFVSKTNPMTTLHPGFRYFQFGDTLRRAEHPDVILEPGADIFVSVDTIAIFSPSAFSTLLGDVGVIFGQVPANLVAIQAALKSRIQISAQSLEAIERKATRTLSIARRVAALPDRLGVLPVFGAKDLKVSMTRHGVDPTSVIDKRGRLSFGDDGVEVFLDVLEGRYFEDDLGGEHRRADRFSARK